MTISWSLERQWKKDNTIQYLFFYNDMLLHYNPSIVNTTHSLCFTHILRCFIPTHIVLFTSTLFHSHPHCFVHIHTVLFTFTMFHSHLHYFIRIHIVLFTSTLCHSHPHYFIRIHIVSFTSTLFHSNPPCIIHIHTKYFFNILLTLHTESSIVNINNGKNKNAIVQIGSNKYKQW